MASAERLLDFATGLANAQNAVALTLYTNVLMTENVHYYGKLGSVEIVRRTVDGFDRVCMRKDLAGLRAARGATVLRDG